jgi:hypothetical protein
MSRFAILIAVVTALPLFAQPAKEVDRAAKWEKEVAGIEKRQAEKMPAKGGVVFAGSSTIRMWDTDKAFPDWKPINSGFGGSEIRDVTTFADRLILKHEPKTIVFYAGDNDLNSGRTPDQVLEDFRAFAETVHRKLPKTRVYFIGIKPSIARWKQCETQSKANAKVKEFCETSETLGYIDVETRLLGEDGKPRKELYREDGLHLSAEGYKILNEAVKQAVK